MLEPTLQLLDASDVTATAGQAIGAAALALLFGTNDGRIVCTTPAGRSILDAQDGLSIVRTRLHAARDHDTFALRQCWHSVVESRLNEARTELLQIERVSGMTPYQLTLSTLGSSARPGSPTIVVQVFDPASTARFSAERLQKLYRLTPSEATIAIAIAQGLSIAAIARSSGRTPGTVRSLLKRAFAKTRTSRQSELAAILWRGAAGPLARMQEPPRGPTQ